MRRARILRRRPQAGRSRRATTAASQPTCSRLLSSGGEWGGPHHVSPSVLSLTQATEAGTVYSVAERRLAAHRRDSARHDVAVRWTARASPTRWRVSASAQRKQPGRPASMCSRFGATKGGAMAAEAVIFFDPARAAAMGERRKRARSSRVQTSLRRRAIRCISDRRCFGSRLRGTPTRWPIGSRRSCLGTACLRSGRSKPIWCSPCLPAGGTQTAHGRRGELLRDAPRYRAAGDVPSTGRCLGAARYLVFDAPGRYRAVRGRRRAYKRRPAASRAGVLFPEMLQLRPKSDHQIALPTGPKCRCFGGLGVPTWRSAVKTAYAACALALSFAIADPGPNHHEPPTAGPGWCRR